MPIYTFYCQDCMTTFEQEIPMKDYPEKSPKFCMVCGFPKAPKRVIISLPVIYKGKGFFTNDNKPSEPE